MSPNGVVPFLRMDSTLTAGFSEIVELVSQKVAFCSFVGVIEVKYDFRALNSQIHSALQN